MPGSFRGPGLWPYTVDLAVEDLHVIAKYCDDSLHLLPVDISSIIILERTPFCVGSVETQVIDSRSGEANGVSSALTGFPASSWRPV